MAHAICIDALSNNSLPSKFRLPPVFKHYSYSFSYNTSGIFVFSCGSLWGKTFLPTFLESKIFRTFTLFRRITSTNGWGITECITNLRTQTQIHITLNEDFSSPIWAGYSFENTRKSLKREPPLTWAIWNRIQSLFGKESEDKSENFLVRYHYNFLHISLSLIVWKYVTSMHRLFLFSCTFIKSLLSMNFVK